MSTSQVIKLVDHFNLNTINPYTNPELRFSKKFVDCCEKSNISYTDIKIKSFISSRIKYQLRADYPEESKGSESYIQINNQLKKIESATSPNSLESRKNINIQIENKEYMVDTSKLNQSNYIKLNKNLIDINNLSVSGVDNSNKNENLNILTEISLKQSESLKPKIINLDNTLPAHNKTKANKKLNKNDIMDIDEDKIEDNLAFEYKNKPINFVNPFVHKDITNNPYNLNHNNIVLNKNSNRKMTLGIFFFA